jgi:hypothetical protein
LLPDLSNQKFRNFKEMANAFDDIIIQENPSSAKMNHFNAIIADEGPLDRSNRSNEQLTSVAAP